MKNYSKSFLEKVQSTIGTPSCACKDVNALEELPNYLKINGVKICLQDDGNGRKDFINYVSDNIVDTEYAKWKHEAAGRFYGKDWKRSMKNPEIYKMYKTIDTVIKNDDNDINIHILIRNIIEEDFTVSEEINNYTDLTIDDEKYAVIKAYVTNTELHEGYQSDSILEERLFEDKFNEISDAFITEAQKSDEDCFENILESSDDMGCCSDENQEELF